MRQQGQYSDSGLNSYSVSQMHHVPSQRMEQDHADPFEGRLEAFTPEREHSFVASKNEDQWGWERDESKMPNSMDMFNEGQGGDATRSYFQGQRPNSKSVLEKGSNSDPRSQSHGKNMESRFGDGLLPQNFDGLEQKFIDDVIKFAKEQNDAEDEENARHREAESESLIYLFSSRSFATLFWNFIRHAFENEKQILWKHLIKAFCWFIWIEKNRRIFQDKTSSYSCFFDTIILYLIS